GRVTGVVVDDGESKLEIVSKFVIGADGVWSRTADRAGSKSYRYFPPSNATYYAYYRGIETDGVYFQFTRGAAAGLIPTNNDEVCVYVGWPAREIGSFRNDPEEAFIGQATAGHPAIGAAVRQGTRVSPFRGTPGLPTFLRQPWGAGWALVGDAGYTKDPISAHGISDALRDAELCARAVDAALKDPGDEREHLSRYRIQRDRLSVSLLEKSARLGSYNWSEPEASELMKGLSLAVRDECEAMLMLPGWDAAGERLTKAS
ncbi:MAG: FAD-dependent monooxygenase, partial [Actinobacteria bacterium]|nr:FAD-dependent monooxygenase [Actinomycetota bacterium]